MERRCGKKVQLRVAQLVAIALMLFGVAAVLRALGDLVG